MCFGTKTLFSGATPRVAEFLKERDEAGLTPDDMCDEERMESASCIVELLSETDNWQSIETAPKDGSYIWLGCDHSIRVGFWRDGAEYEHHGSVGGGWRDKCAAEQLGMCDLHFTPTHWMPTPKPPRAQVFSARAQLENDERKSNGNETR